MNSLLKRTVERGLVLGGVAAVARRRVAGSTLVLAYHGIVPEGERPRGDASLHLPQAEFARQLDVIANDFDVVPLAAIARPADGPRPRVVITFDDAYAGALAAGVPELVRRGLPATIFVAPGLLGETTWWDLLARDGHGEVAENDREHALTALAGRRDAVLRWAAERGYVPGADAPRIADERALARSVDEPGITVGAHSWGHPNLAALDDAALVHELTAPLEWLRVRFPDRTVPWLAYPYGLFSDAVARAAAAAGYAGAFRVDGGWMHGRAAPPHALPRYNVPAGLSLDGLRLRLAGIGA